VQEAPPAGGQLYRICSADPSTEMECYLAARPALAVNAAVRDHCELALELLAPFHAELLPQLPALTPLWTHNDLHASNLFWSDAGDGAQATAIIDFGLADRTNAVHDLAHAIERNIVEWLALMEDVVHLESVPVHLDHLHALLTGYESVRPLSEQEAAALAPMTALCHAEFALSEADYFLGVLHSKEKAQMASRGWLVGHARWFRGAGGRKLLDAMGRWVETRNRHSREFSIHELDCNCELPLSKLAGDCGHRHHGAGHLAHHASTPHLLAGSAGRGCDLPDCLLSRAAILRCAAAGILLVFTLYGWWHWWRGVCAEGEMRVVPLSARGWLGDWWRVRWVRCCWLVNDAHGRGAAPP